MASLGRLTNSDSLGLSFPTPRSEECDFMFKIVVIGDSGVGKTCALKRFRYGTYSERHANTIGVDFTLKTVEVEGKIVQLNIWDTAGQERYRTITHSYYRNAHGVVAAYDITRERSFTNLRRWFEDIKKYCGEVPILVIATKLDLVSQNPQLRVIDTSSGEQLKSSESNNVVAFSEISAKEGINVDSAFMELALELKRRKEIVNGCSCDKDLSNVYTKNIDTVRIDIDARRSSCDC